MELTKRQEEGLKIAVQRYIDGEKFTVISGYAGSGKAQPINTIIPTPNGNIELGKIQVGDYVFDRKGKPTKVLGVYPQGLKEKYKVVLSDGRETICASDHLWSYYTSGSNLVSKTAEEMLNSGLKNSNGFKYKIPTNEPIQYSTKEYIIDPYLIGVFLGDGCCKERYLTLSSETEEIPNLVGEIINATPIRNSETNYNWSFEWNDEAKAIKWICGHGAERSTERKKPKTLDYFEKYEKYLMQYANEKDIPPEYKYGDIEQRLSLVQGLMDTDGSINSTDNHRYNMRFTSTSLKLIKSLQEVLFSLGYSSTIHSDERKEKYTTNICYSLNINIPNEEKYKFFRLKRKRDIALEAQKYHKRKDYSKISIVDIIPLEEMTEMVCIYVDNSEHLYLTNDCIVTHNTTLVKFITNALSAFGVDPQEDIVYCAYTGKAVEVLRQKGNSNCKTAHKLLYKTIPTPSGKFIYEPVEYIPEKVVVVDECSMLPMDMAKLLLSYNVYVIFCGDPGQLPPIIKSQNNNLLYSPHIFLDEIMRQAQESGIIRLSMKIRNGESINGFKSKEAIVIPRSELNPSMLIWADQILCATNETRNYINQTCRNLRGYTNIIEEGEKLIATKNDWDTISDLGGALTNGCVGVLNNIRVSDIHLGRYFNFLGIPDNKIPIITGDFVTDYGDTFEKLVCDKQSIVTGTPLLDNKTKFILRKHKKQFGGIIPEELTYGYCITTHKAQGSEWSKVVAIEENFPQAKEEHKQWLYTACTRSAEKLVLVS